MSSMASVLTYLFYFPFAWSGDIIYIINIIYLFNLLINLFINILIYLFDGYFTPFSILFSVYHGCQAIGLEESEQRKTPNWLLSTRAILPNGLRWSQKDPTLITWGRGFWVTARLRAYHFGHGPPPPIPTAFPTAFKYYEYFAINLCIRYITLSWRVLTRITFS